MYKYLRNIIDDYKAGDSTRLRRKIDKALEYEDIDRVQHDELLKILIYKHKTVLLSQ